MVVEFSEASSAVSTQEAGFNAKGVCHYLVLPGLRYQTRGLTESNKGKEKS